MGTRTFSYLCVALIVFEGFRNIPNAGWRPSWCVYSDVYMVCIPEHEACVCMFSICMVDRTWYGSYYLYVTRIVFEGFRNISNARIAMFLMNIATCIWYVFRNLCMVDWTLYRFYYLTVENPLSQSEPVEQRIQHLLYRFLRLCNMDSIQHESHITKWILFRNITHIRLKVHWSHGIAK